MRLLCTVGLVGLLAAVPEARTVSAQSMNDMVRTLNNVLNPGDAQRLEDQARRNGRSQEERDYRAGLEAPDRYRRDQPDGVRGDYRSRDDYRDRRGEGCQGYSGNGVTITINGIIATINADSRGVQNQLTSTGCH